MVLGPSRHHLFSVGSRSCSWNLLLGTDILQIPFLNIQVVKIANEVPSSPLCSGTQNKCFRREKLLPLFSCGEVSLLLYFCQQSMDPKALTQYARAILMYLHLWEGQVLRQKRKHVLNEFENENSFPLKHSADECQ